MNVLNDVHLHFVDRTGKPTELPISRHDAGHILQSMLKDRVYSQTPTATLPEKIEAVAMLLDAILLAIDCFSDEPEQYHSAIIGGLDPRVLAASQARSGLTRDDFIPELRALLHRACGRPESPTHNAVQGSFIPARNLTEVVALAIYWAVNKPKQPLHTACDLLIGYLDQAGQQVAREHAYFSQALKRYVLDDRNGTGQVVVSLPA